MQEPKSPRKKCLLINQNCPSAQFVARMLKNIKWRWCAGRAVIWRQWTVSRCAWELEAGAAASDQEQELRRQWQIADSDCGRITECTLYIHYTRDVAMKPWNIQGRESKSLLNTKGKELRTSSFPQYGIWCKDRFVLVRPKFGNHHGQCPGGAECW